ncbi:MAG: hypothetical protein GDA43_20770 [Hormoscilla sp. SP5CHS1]|nr:hypothetical protein [Hormoscilla sp. SP12CHS1]MBC6455333.1 hypothetical protein [Hormoscilla sp. SP5CHS1]MBC6474025.1 hypothetical protein [Hormoscilla sp. GM102CHS1]
MQARFHLPSPDPSGSRGIAVPGADYRSAENCCSEGWLMNSDMGGDLAERETNYSEA